jgi:hypothetical protein
MIKKTVTTHSDQGVTCGETVENQIKTNKKIYIKTVAVCTFESIKRNGR